MSDDPNGYLKTSSIVNTEKEQYVCGFGGLFIKLKASKDPVGYNIQVESNLPTFKATTIRVWDESDVEEAFAHLIKAWKDAYTLYLTKSQSAPSLSTEVVNGVERPVVSLLGVSLPPEVDDEQ